MKRFCLLCGLLLLVPHLLSAQDASGKRANESVFSLQAGPAWHLGAIPGLTNPSDAYCCDMRSGMGWNLSWLYDVRKEKNDCGIMVGFRYQGSRYKASHEEGSDKVGMDYVAPQFGMSYRSGKFHLYTSVGMGFQFYKDKSKVFGKSREVTVNRLACNLSLNGEYRFSRHWGVAAQAGWVWSYAEGYRVSYHGESWRVESDNYGSFHQVGVLLGVNLHW